MTPESLYRQEGGGGEFVGAGGGGWGGTARFRKGLPEHAVRGDSPLGIEIQGD